MAPKDNTDLIGVKQAARLLGIEPRTMRDLCKRGRVRGAWQVGRDWIIPVGKNGLPKMLLSGMGRPPRWAKVAKKGAKR